VSAKFVNVVVGVEVTLVGDVHGGYNSN